MNDIQFIDERANSLGEWEGHEYVLQMENAVPCDVEVKTFAGLGIFVESNWTEVGNFSTLGDARGYGHELRDEYRCRAPLRIIGITVKDF